MTDDLTTTALIRKVFHGLSAEDLESLRSVATLRRCSPGEVLCHEGVAEHVFYIVSDGAALIYQMLPDGEERILDYRREGQFFGELALIDNAPRSASVRALTDLSVLQITEDMFDSILERSPAVAFTIMSEMVRSLRHTDARAISELKAKNELLAQAYRELQEAQAQLVERAVMKHELEMAAEVQQGLLPRDIPHFHNYAFAGHNTPARQIGGDLYDVLWVDNDHVGVLLADVSDKSIHAALYMAITKTLFQTWSKQTLSPLEVARHVHEGLLEASSRDEMFVTAFYGVLDCTTGEMRYVRAGQERALRVSRDGRVEVLPGEGRFLGMLPVMLLEERSVTLAPGDALVLYSDGIPDTTNAHGDQFGQARLRAVLEAMGGRCPEHIIEAMLHETRAFQGDAPQFDDITMLVASAVGEETRGGTQ